MDKHEYEERVFDATCETCGRTTHATTKRLEELGWFLKYKEVACPAHNPAALGFAAQVSEILRRHNSTLIAASTR